MRNRHAPSSAIAAGILAVGLGLTGCSSDEDTVAGGGTNAAEDNAAEDNADSGGATTPTARTPAAKVPPRRRRRRAPSCGPARAPCCRWSTAESKACSR